MIRTILSALALVMCCGSANALPCLTKADAVATGKHAHYRQVGKQRCWYVGLHTPAKTEFTPRSTSVAARPTRLITQQEQTRVEEPSGAAPDPGITHTDYRALVEDAFLALTGRSEESYVSFDAYWREMTGFAR